MERTITENDENLWKGCDNLKKRNLKKIRTVKMWGEDESSSVIKFFTSHIKRGSVPGKSQCEECIEKFPVLHNRRWTDIKFYVKNYITKINRKKNRISTCI